MVWLLPLGVLQEKLAEMNTTCHQNENNRSYLSYSLRSPKNICHHLLFFPNPNDLLSSMETFFKNVLVALFHKAPKIAKCHKIKDFWSHSIDFCEGKIEVQDFIHKNATFFKSHWRLFIIKYHKWCECILQWFITNHDMSYLNMNIFTVLLLRAV